VTTKITKLRSKVTPALLTALSFNDNAEKSGRDNCCNFANMLAPLEPLVQKPNHEQYNF
jgi:hypothetical protein